MAKNISQSCQFSAALKVSKFDDIVLDILSFSLSIFDIKRLNIFEDELFSL